MSFCSNCGSSLQQGTTYCPNCGASAPSNAPVQVNTPVQINVPTNKEVISVGGWIGRTLIPYIPIVGSIVYLIMLFVWSGDTKKEDSFRNWAKAQLVVMAISIVLAILLVIILGPVLSEYLN